MVNLDTLLKSIPKITPKYVKVLEKLGLLTVQDLLLYFPFRYDDFSRIVEIDEKYIGAVITVEGKVEKARNNRIFRRRMTVQEVTITDKNGTPLKLAWFNQPYILEGLSIGSGIRVSGKLEQKGKHFSMTSPAWEKSGRDATNTGRLVPVYSETTGISSKWIRWQLKPLLYLAKDLPDVLPHEIRQKFNLYDIYTAITQIHFPDSKEKLIRAQKRFAFQEMFLVQLKSLQVKHQWEDNNSIAINFDEKLIKNFVEKLPFTLTDAQRKSSFEILKDLEKPKPMNRLLEGDVGSGKTVVAAMATLQAISSGYQVAIMAPTEVLARQHFESFCELFKDYDFNVALLTNSYKIICEFNQEPSPVRQNFKKNLGGHPLPKGEEEEKNFHLSPRERSSQSAGSGEGTPLDSINFKTIARNKLLENIKSGKINLIIGTHALIQKDVKFKNLALVIIDEQHRFGVAQRAFLQQETMSISDGNNKIIPHLLTMTATPIPRSLAIAFFGSLDLSILDEMPKNRKPISTKIVPPTGRKEVYNFIRNEINSGRQIFVIFPLVEESKALSEVKAATKEHKKLQEIFPEFQIGLMHGRLKAKEKEEVMRDFKDKKSQILVSTSVVEVGIDVPNATIMIIENAERFGLSQLHQFRGRVGRSEHQSYCFLFTGAGKGSGTFFATKKVPDPLKRLKALEKTNDGFEISKIDLELRGPGQFFGTIQSGLPDIAMENLTNVKLIKFAREEAQTILKDDPQLKKHPALRDALRKFSEKIHLE
ncbi:MAG: ATP-dependent DNA helicase RecG [Parcubacteria group bacterium]|jgi:ATP-dependent DNA helicase RecG